jgi:integrase
VYKQSRKFQGKLVKKLYRNETIYFVDKMTAIEEIRRALENYLAVGHSQSTQNCYMQIFGRTSQHAPALLENIGAPQAEDIRAYLADLKKRGHGASSLRLHYFFLKTLTENVMRGNWPLDKRDAPPEPELEEYRRPILSEERINTMIEKMRKSPYIMARTRFAVSTIYGARRVELGDLVAENINLETMTIRIRTRKHGIIRTHLIPNEMKPYISPEELEPMSEWQMSELFKRIEAHCGLKHEPNFGWHSIRRRLATWLDDHGISEPDIYRFMRWKRRRTILDRYIVRTEAETDRRLAEVDKAIFAVHPFLRAWARDSMTNFGEHG